MLGIHAESTNEEDEHINGIRYDVKTERLLETALGKQAAKL